MFEIDYENMKEGLPVLIKLASNTERLLLLKEEGKLKIYSMV